MLIEIKWENAFWMLIGRWPTIRKLQKKSVCKQNVLQQMCDGIIAGVCICAMIILSVHYIHQFDVDIARVTHTISCYILHDYVTSSSTKAVLKPHQLPGWLTDTIAESSSWFYLIPADMFLSTHGLDYDYAQGPRFHWCHFFILKTAPCSLNPNVKKIRIRRISICCTLSIVM